MIHKLYYKNGSGTDPYENLGLEEYLLYHIQPGECILYLWQNEKTVVIGRNQNAWKECRTEKLEADGGRLARRLSGGGAVFHDLGNLNFTFLVRKADYDIAKQTRVVLEAVKSLGLMAECSGRNDLTIDGGKFSGNAYFETGDFCYHHGTILLSADTNAMTGYLHVSGEKLQSKGVDSIKNRVRNLCSFLPDLTVEEMRRQMIRSFETVYGLPAEEYPDDRLNREEILDFTQKYASWEWNYGRKIPFTDSLARRFPWGELEILVNVSGGRIRDIRISSDTLDIVLLQTVESVLRETKWNRSALCEQISSIPCKGELQQKMRDNLTEMIVWMESGGAMEKQYDLIVIGAGPGGYLPAIRAAKAGKRVAVVERESLGGTCLNCGCIPTKTYLHTTELLREARLAAATGLMGTEGLSVDMEQLKKRKDQVVEGLRDGIAKQFAACKIDLYRGTGIVGKNHDVGVTGNQDQEGKEENLSGTYILVAVGSEPVRLPIPGAHLPGVENSTTMLERSDLYRRLVIIGGGVIGMEFATVYHNLGCEVTVLEAADRILPGMDKEIIQNLKMIMKKRGVSIHTGAAVKSIGHNEDGSLSCIYTEKEQEYSLETDGILVAAGRKPCTEGVFSDECRGEVLMERGGIVVDEHYETAIPGVYAVGDAIGGVQLAHVATAEGYTAISHMFKELPVKNMEAVPSCVYTDPEIACVGMTADQAKAAGIPVKTGKYIMSVNGKSVLSMQERGFIKIVAEAESGRVIGAQLMCARATDIIGELTLAVAKGLTAGDLAEIIEPHPTFCEGVGEAAEEI